MKSIIAKQRKLAARVTTTKDERNGKKNKKERKKLKMDEYRGQKGKNNKK